MPRPSSAPKLLDAAELCLVEGTGDFEMRDVSTRAGASEGLAYHYFRNKAGLVTAVVARFFDRYDAVMNRHRDRNIPWAERERERLEDLIAFLYADPVAPLVFGSMSRLPETAAAEAQRRQDIVSRAAHNIRSGIEQGTIDPNIDSDIAGAAIIGAVNEVVTHSLRQSPPPTEARLADELWRIIAAIVGIAP